MTIKEIIKVHLLENGFDGLVHTHAECGCELNDLMPCECCNVENCEPAYKCKGEDGFDFTMRTVRQEEKP